MRASNAFLALNTTHKAITVSDEEIVIPTTYECAGMPIGIQVLEGIILVASGESAATNGNKIDTGDYMEFNAGKSGDGNDLRVVRSGTDNATVQIWVYEGN